MKWTGADLIVQLEEGWEIDEIASATGLGIAEVRRLVRDERYRMRQQIKEEELADKRMEVEEKETTEAVDIHAWNMISVLAEQPGSPAVATIASRAESEDPKWTHYESIPVEEVEGDWHRRTTALYRLREGTGWEALEIADPKSKVVNHADQAARIASLERELAAAREKIEEWKRRATEAEHDLDIEGSHLAAIGEALEPIGDFAGKDTPVEERITRLVERSIRDHADLYTMQQVALEFMEKYGVSDEGWKDAEMADYVRAACQGIEDHYDKQIKELAELAGRLPSVRSELDRVSENLLAVHRECERQGYGADDKRAAVENVRELIDYTEEVVNLVARQDQRIKELESKLELAPERHDLPLIVEDWKRIKAHLANGGHPAAGSCLAPTIEKLLDHSIELQEVRRLEADGPTENDETPLDRRLEDLVDLEFEIANQYARRATDDFAELEQRCWDLKQAKKHYRRREVLMQEWCEEEGR